LNGFILNEQQQQHRFLLIFNLEEVKKRVGKVKS